MTASAVANGQTVIEAGSRLGDLSLLTEAERQRILVEWNQTRAQYLARCVHEAFEDQVRQTPHAIAVVGDHGYLTFDQLNRRANQLAHYLRRLGAGPEMLVGISMGRSLDMLIALWGILKAGAAYVPLEPTLPAERLKFMLQDSQVPILLTEERFLVELPESSARRICFDRSGKEINCEDEHNPEPQADPDNLAYVIYTSGSTGSPKGVAVDHRSVVNFFRGMDDRIACGPNDSLLSVTSISFDISALELFWTLTRGAKVILVTEPLDIFAATDVPVTNLSIHSLRVSKRSLRDLADQHQPTLMQCTPSMIRMLASGGALSVLHSLQTLMLGGEPLLPSLVRELRNTLSCRLVNMYGPTETTIWSSTSQVEQIISSISVGAPIANTEFYILDRVHSQPVPVGVIGELFIGGEGVARGYRYRPDLTADRFIPDPFSLRFGGRLYKTGDFARYLADGRVELLGRSDHQVKIRGYRIELGEIEAALLQHPNVQQTVVAVREDASDEKQLVAYIVSGSAVEPRPRFDQIREFLKSRLPDYMIPGVFVPLSEIPLNQNGKIDRKRLPAPQLAQDAADYVSPQDHIQETLCGIWSTVLGVEHVGAHDSFFALGGHSLLATRVLTRVRDAFLIDLPLRTVLENPTIAELAARVHEQIKAGSRTKIPSITKRRHQATIPLSYAQERLWLLSQIDGASEAYHISMTFGFQGKFDQGILRRSLNTIVARHEILRSTFLVANGEPVQRILPAEDSQIYITEDDIGQHPQSQAELERLLALEARALFDLEHGPLIRARLIRQAEDEYALQITVHHIVADGWSLAVLINELNNLYTAFLNGKEDPLPALQVQYADYAIWQRQWMQGDALRAQADYWATTLAGIPELLEVPADHVRPAQQNYAGALASIELDENVTIRLRKLSQRQGTTLYMTLIAAWAAVLGRLSNQYDVMIGTAVANRDRLEIEPLIGFFVNTLALRFDLSGSPSINELLERVKRQILAAHRYRDIPFEHVVKLLRPARTLAHTPLFQAMFIWQDMPDFSLNLPGLELKWLRTTSPVTAKFDLTLWLQESNGRILGGLEYATDLFERSTIDRHLSYLRTFLDGMLAGDTQNVDFLPVMPETERHQVLYGWNNTTVHYPNVFIHELFEAQVLKQPEAIAVVYEDKMLTYGELNRKANRLAHHLRSVGVVPDARIAICMDRNLEMIVALLAVLKAGGAYVPLDPGYPIERLRYMLEDSSPVLLLTEQHLQKLFNGCHSDLTVFDVHSLISACSEQPESNLDPADLELTLNHLAYVIYTSGSTGVPKGVQLPLRGLTNFLLSMRDRPGLTEADTFVAAATISFDIAGYEIWLPLMVGARIVLVDRPTAADGGALLECLHTSGATVLQATPTTWRLLLAAGWQGTRGLKMLCGAEALSDDLAGQLVPRGAELWNLYGPTETSVWSMAYRVTPESIRSRTILIGRPIANIHVYVLNALGQPVPVGVVGELYIGGVGVSRGYVNRPQFTAERFLPNPFVHEPGAVMYRTGDFGRWLADGNIEFLGRNDFQVKVRGFRIELGEIEARLAAHPAITQAAVMVREDAGGNKRLVAYYTSLSTEEGIPKEVNAEQLRMHLSTHLPEHMLPAAYVQLEKMPLTPTGKLDRKALPLPVEQAHAKSSYELPVGNMETALARIWAEVLKFERIGRRDNFFELGGHSLLAVQVMTRLRQSLGVQVSMKNIFAYPVLADLAHSLEKAVGVQSPTIELVKRGKRLPSSYAQRRLWFMDQMNPESSFYNLNGAVWLRGKLEVGVLQRTLAELVKRHEALRTRFEVMGGEVMQVVEEEGRIDLREEDLSGIAEEGEREEELRQLLRGEAQKPYDLRRGPLVRGLLVKLGKEEHALMLGMHHIVSDGWSMGVLVRELTVMYEEVSQGREVELERLSIQYGDYAVWQREWLKGEVLERQMKYWRKQLGGAPRVLELPTDHPRPRVQKFRGTRYKKNLRAGLREELMSICGQRSATFFMGALAAFKLVLSYCTSKDDIVIGTHLANRTHLETEGLIGFFVNQLALRTDLSGNPTFVDLLERVRNMVLEAFAHQDVPFDLLVAELRPERSTSYSPIYQLLFTAQEASVQFAQIPGLKIEPVEVPLEAARFDLVVTVGEIGQNLVVFVEYDTELFEVQSVARLAELYEAVLDHVVRHPLDTKESILALMANHDRQYRKERSAELGKVSIERLQRFSRRGMRSL